MMNQPKKNMAESVLARAELYRRGLMFDGVPQFSDATLQLPPGPDAAAPAASPGTPADGLGGAPAAAPGAADALVAGAVAGQSPLETVVTP